MERDGKMELRYWVGAPTNSVTIIKPGDKPNYLVIFPTDAAPQFL